MKIGIIGAGASGIAAALTANKYGAQVTLLEHMPRIGKKLLLTGSGKCNISNYDQNIIHYHGGNREKIEHVLKECPLEETLSFWEDAGLYLRDKGGYIYPFTESSATVLDVLRFALRDSDIKVICDCKIDSVSLSGKGSFNVNCSSGKFSFDRLIICAGSKAYKNTGSDGSGYDLAQSFGHKLIKPLPALTYLNCDKDCFKSLAGIRTYAGIEAVCKGNTIASDKGQLQLTKSGVSGIPAFNISYKAARALDAGQKVTVRIDFLDKISKEELIKRLHDRIAGYPDRNAEELLVGMLHKNIGLLLLKEAGIRPSLKVAELKDKELLRLAGNIKSFESSIVSTGDFDASQVCSGGVSLDEVGDDLQSKIIKGLYFAGEILDVNGDCGGYNLQWAFSSGMHAGKMSTL